MSAFAAGAPLKWTDNLLSQHHVEEVRSERRGVARKVSHAGLVKIALVRQLTTALGMSVSSALELAGQLLRAGGSAQIGPLSVRLDRAELERLVDVRLAEALESAPAPRRGRPRARPQT